jgi:hypothetical protein
MLMLDVLKAGYINDLDIEGLEPQRNSGGQAVYLATDGPNIGEHHYTLSPAPPLQTGVRAIFCHLLNKRSEQASVPVKSVNVIIWIELDPSHRSFGSDCQ